MPVPVPEVKTKIEYWYGEEENTQQIKDMVIAMADRFPGGRLIFDAVGKIGRDKLMKGTLKSMGLEMKMTIPKRKIRDI